MGEDTRAIREEIEETRERMGDTVDALAYKADVKTRAKESVSDKVSSVKEKVVGAKDSVTESVGGAKESVTGTVSDRTPDGDQVKRQAKHAVGVAQENPLGLALGSVAVGFVAGMLIPSTRVEDEKLGPVADQVKEKAQETGQAALEHGRQVAQDVAQTAKDAGQQAVQQTKEAAQSSGQEHAQQVKDEAQGKAGEAQESVGSSSPGGSF
jgi:gas vesicle protein